MLQLFDLAGAEDNRRFSPTCWRTRMALAHKGLPVRTIAWRLTEKDAIAASGQTRVPILVDNGAWISDSWTIAVHLENNYPDRPSLFGGGSGLALSRFYSIWSESVLVLPIIKFILLDIYNRLHEKDRAYFRKTREAFVGSTLEDFVADRDAHVESFRALLAPLRLTLKAQPYLGGDQPLYADYAVFGLFQWARCISPYPILEAQDPVASWRGRLLRAFDGLAGSAPGYDD